MVNDLRFVIQLLTHDRASVLIETNQSRICTKTDAITVLRGPGEPIHRFMHGTRPARPRPRPRPDLPRAQ